MADKNIDRLLQVNSLKSGRPHEVNLMRIIFPDQGINQSIFSLYHLRSKTVLFVVFVFRKDLQNT